jgi:hypothetical protein
MRGRRQLKRRSPAPRPGFPRLPSVSPISWTHLHVQKRQISGLPPPRTIKRRTVAERSRFPGSGRRVKKAQKLPNCNYAPAAGGTRITRLMGFPSPSWFPPNGTPKRPRPPPVGAFSFLGHKPPALHSSNQAARLAGAHRAVRLGDRPALSVVMA